MGGPSLPPTSNVSLRPINYEFAIQPIEQFSPGPLGQADDSVSIKAAHDAAFAAGVRELYCHGQYNAPTAYNLGDVIFRGPGALIGTYRKKIIPLSTRPLTTLGPKIIPSIHLPRFCKALNPTVLIWGDSTGTTGANHISAAEMIWTMLQRAFLRANPGRTINRVNRAIGGTDYTQFNNTGTTLIAAGVSLPSWFNPTTAPWTGFISNQNPDLVIIDWGTNNPTAAVIGNILSSINFLLGLTKVPDILLCTNLPRSTQADSGSAEVAALEARDFAAGATRAVAEFDGFGCFDLHRIGCIARDGFDPCTQVMTQNLVNQTYSLPAVLPATQQDYDVTFTIDNTGGAAFGGSQVLGISLSSQSGNDVRVKSSGSVFQILGYDGSANGQWQVLFTTSINVPTSVVTIEVSIRGNWVSIYIQGVLAYENLMRKQGASFTPTIYYATGSGATQVVVTQYVNSSPALVAPSITDAEMFGVSPFLQGGNGVNHPASPTYETAISLVIDDASLAAASAGRPTQSIAAAGAINTIASLVEITGPATSTYAITLAAPTVTDQGNDIAIEMVATTSSNTVTLALTNVVGGTASTTCTWNGAGQQLVVKACGSAWLVIKQNGVTLT